MLRFLRLSYYSWIELQGHIQPVLLAITKIVNPLFTMLFFIFMVKHARPESDMTFLVLGNALLINSFIAAFNMAVAFTRERQRGTLSLIIASPVSRIRIFLAKGFLFLIEAFLISTLALTLGVILTGQITLHTSWIPGCLLLFFVGVFSSFCIGAAVSVLNLLVRDILIITNSLWFTLVAFSGVHVNPECLPLVMLKLKTIIPMSHAINGLRIITSSKGVILWGDVFVQMGLEVIIGLVYLSLGFVSLTLIEKTAIKSGRLDLSS